MLLAYDSNVLSDEFNVDDVPGGRVDIPTIIITKEVGEAIMSLGAIATLEKTEIDQKLQNAGYCTARDFLRDSLLKAILEDSGFEEYLKSKHKM